MARGVGEITGAAAIGSVGGTALALLIPALVFWALSRRLRRQAALEKASLNPAMAPLASGPAALAGTVEVSDGGAAPVEVVIEEQRDGTDWREVSRTITARPFVLRLASGIAVHVEPGAAPLLLDALDPVEWSREARRQRVAQLSVNEPVFVRGVLRVSGDPRGGDPYRGAEAFVLSAPPHRRLVLSTEALSGALERRADEHFGRCAILLVLLALGLVLYLDVCYAAVAWLVAAAPPPSLQFDVYFWVMLVSGLAIVGAVASSWSERPWYVRRAPRS
ncbi:hypothetical protein OV090_47540 [Nannocystis sp. RBIL2]|uniref:hypothetical protein n=1 Tax=Nannocystis sp. RBIL2 TaxID=2996788 RepID=UPI00226D99DA|nr:hypothetical protein [Nannocystis sp. RBIL2]MCY1072492.1 hypothetical protein [Nannocystis sp. RBIL2]